MERPPWRDEPRRPATRRALCVLRIRRLDVRAPCGAAVHHGPVAGQRAQPPEPPRHVPTRCRVRRTSLAVAGPADPPEDDPRRARPRRSGLRSGRTARCGDRSSVFFTAHAVSWWDDAWTVVVRAADARDPPGRRRTDPR